MRRVLAAALACLLLAGCGKTEKELDMEALANDLLEGGVFEETLYPAEESAIPLLLGFETACEGLVYVGTGATAEELLLLKAADEAEAQAIRDRLADHLADRTESFAAYLPAETEKLEKAILELRGTAVVLCVCGDPEAARAILEEKG